MAAWRAGSSSPGSARRHRSPAPIWDLKGKPGLLDGVVLEGETRDQRLKITPFPRPGQYATWEPYRQTIETTEGVLVAERRDPAASFAGLTRRSRWDEFQVAYFAGEANWNYFTAPFILARSDFVTEETEHWHEDGQTWRSLLVTYPDSIVAHTKRQTYYFDDTGLLRRGWQLRDPLDLARTNSVGRQSARAKCLRRVSRNVT